MHTMQEYFDRLEKETKEVYKLAEAARKKGIDPIDHVEIPLARNMAERVEGIISVVAPQIKDSGIAARISELEKQFGILDWRVALTIALEVAQQKFCKFDEKKTAMEVGIRVGFAYITVGVVASPLEGFVELKLKKRKDGQKYFCLMYSGPIRSAGGTGSSVSVIIADYIRAKMGYEPYDPTKDEINRTVTEINDYHEKVTNLQYYPSEEEIRFLAENLPVQIDGDPSEKYEVSNYKDQERIETNRIRNGPCLVMAECLAQKAAKVHKQLTKWGSDFGLDHWGFLEKFIKIQEKIKAKGKITTDAKILPDYTYIKDIVGGRPVLTHPLRHGGFRLRYGRTRTSGFSADALHPATLVVLKSYIAIGTQLKTERPGKGTTVSICDRIEGPIVRLNNGNVLYFDDASGAEKYANDIDEILYLGDILINYGDFFNRAHRLVPCGFNEEWYKLILEKAGVEKDADHMAAEEAIRLSVEFSVPLHPRHTFHWRAINKEQLIILLGWFQNAVIEGEKVILPFVNDVGAYLEGKDPKRVLELVGVPHSVAGGEHVVIAGDYAKAICANLGLPSEDIGMLIQNITNSSETDTLKLVNMASRIEIYDKSGTFIGARMGRPEKAKMRKMTGSPHVLFPVGSEGGKMRSFQAAIEKGKVTAEFMLFYCGKCNAETIDSTCANCGAKLKAVNFCLKCNAVKTDDMCEQHGKVGAYNRKSIDINEQYSRAIKLLKLSHKPELVKGVRGTSNKAHFPENLAKGILRAAYNVYVNKDGTIRYDMTEQALTHFKPKEIGTPIDKLKLLGYTMDMYGNELKDENQIVELMCQDVVLPACKEADEDGADEVLFRSAQFIDSMLEKVYGLEKFYNLKSKDDIVGHLVVGLSPHTSAGVVARIIGFSKTQGFMAHPLYHSLLRRDADGDEAAIMLLTDALINFSRHFLPGHRGAVQDAPLVLTSKIIPTEVDDMVFDLDVAEKYPLELYEAAQQFKFPWEIKIEQLKHNLGTEKQYSGYRFTHDTDNFNNGIRYSAYKSIPTMREKVLGQMELAEKIRAVDEVDVARLVIERHFIRDIKGNLRKFSLQQFRCVNCNEKYRRPPLNGKCRCNGRIIFTISEGSITKYLEPSLQLIDRYDLPAYLKQTVELTKAKIEGIFGKEKETQSALKQWF